MARTMGRRSLRFQRQSKQLACGSPAGVAKAASTSGRVLQTLNLLHLDLNHRGNDHLRHPIPRFNRHRLLPQIHQQHLDLAAVVPVDGAWGVGDGQTVAEGQPERGRIWASKPWGMAMASPVSTATRSPGASTIGSLAADDKSIPAAPSVI